MSSSCESLNQSMSRLNSTPEFPPGRSRVGEAALLCVIDSMGVHLLLGAGQCLQPSSDICMLKGRHGKHPFVLTHRLDLKPSDCLLLHRSAAAPAHAEEPER